MPWVEPAHTTSKPPCRLVRGAVPAAPAPYDLRCSHSLDCISYLYPASARLTCCCVDPALHLHYSSIPGRSLLAVLLIHSPPALLSVCILSFPKLNPNRSTSSAFRSCLASDPLGCPESCVIRNTGRWGLRQSTLDISTAFAPPRPQHLASAPSLRLRPCFATFPSIRLQAMLPSIQVAMPL